MAKHDERLEMIHPSYVELMRIINHDVVVGEEPVVNSRYTIVAACAKRARQLIDGAEPMIDNAEGLKPLTIAVEELKEGKLKILTEDEAAEAAAKAAARRQAEEDAKAAAENAAKAAEALGAEDDADVSEADAENQDDAS